MLDKSAYVTGESGMVSPRGSAYCAAVGRGELDAQSTGESDARGTVCLLGWWPSEGRAQDRAWVELTPPHSVWVEEAGAPGGRRPRTPRGLSDGSRQQLRLLRVRPWNSRRLMGRLFAEPFARLSVVQLLEEVSDRGINDLQEAI